MTNCEISLNLTCLEDCVMIGCTSCYSFNSRQYKIVPESKNGFKGTISWNKYISQMRSQAKKNSLN